MSEWFFKKINWLTGCVATAFLFGLVTFAANIEIKDIDLWLHLAVGKYIVQNFSIPYSDILSCTITNTPWINHEWLFQTAVFSVYNASGVDGLISLRVWIVFLTFALLLFLGYTREFKFSTIAVLLLVLLVYQLRMTLRPDIFSLLFFVLYIMVIGMHLDKQWSLWALAFIQVLWTNMHGFFIFGPMIVFISLMGEWMKRHVTLPFAWNTIGRYSDREYKRLKQLMAVSLLACLLNPYFLEGAWYPFSVLFSLGGESKIFFKQIQELQRPLHWHTLLSWQPYLHYKLLILISFFSFVLNRRRIDINALTLWFVFLLFSLSALRNIVFFALAAYFAFLTNYQFISEQTFLPVKYNNVKFRTACSAALKILLIIWIANYGNRLMLRGYYDFDKFERKSEYGGVSLRNFPYKAVDFLVTNNIKGNFLNDFNSGAYLLGRTSPNIKVFIDGRTEVYGAEFYNTYQKIWKGDTKLFEEAVGRYHLTGAFLNSVYVPGPEKTIAHLYKSEEWILVYFDYDAAIFLRDIPENRQWINRYRMDLTQWQTPDADLLKIGTRKVTPYRHVNRAYALFNMGLRGKAQQEAVEALRIEPYNTQAHKLLGRIYNERGEYLAAFESLRKAKLLNPDDRKIRYQLAVALVHLGEIEKAKEQCQKVLDQDPKNIDGLFLLSLIYVKEHEYDKAVNVLKSVLSYAPDDTDGFFKVSKLLAEQGESRRSKEVYGMGLERDRTKER